MAETEVSPSPAASHAKTARKVTAHLCAPSLTHGEKVYRETGQATWYGNPRIEGRHTASGERFDHEALTSAHPSLPFHTKVRVTNLRNGQAVIVRINDRNKRVGKRIIDLSRRADARAVLDLPTLLG